MGRKFSVILLSLLCVFIFTAEGKARGGEFIAYLRLTGDYWQVWIVNPDGSGARALTRDPVDKISVSVGENTGEILYNTNLGQMHVLKIAGQSHKIPMPLTGMTDGDLAPGGGQVVFSMNTMDSIDNNDIWIVGTDGKKLRKLTRMRALQHDPTWCPDEKRIAFLSGEGKHNHDIFLMDLKEKRLEQVTVDNLYNFEPSCSQGGEIAFSSNRTGDYEIWTMNLESKVQTKITNHSGLDSSPAWSPDGSEIVFVSDRSGYLELWKINRSGKGLVQLTNEKSGCRSPGWGRTP